MKASEHFAVFTEVKAGEVEVRQVVAMADIEEEVGRPPKVPVLEQFDQRKLEDVLVEGYGSFDIAAEHSKMMESPRRRSRSFSSRPEVAVLQGLPFRASIDVASVPSHWHFSLVEPYPQNPHRRRRIGDCK